MINIISRSLLFKKTSGPKKVVESLIKGLDELGYPYVVNKGLDSCQRLYIHDDRKALSKIKDLPKGIKVVAGPNIFNLVRHIPEEMDFSRAVYLQPSKWSRDCFIYFGFNKCPLDYWPTGIDTNQFKPSLEEKKFVLIYFKDRFESELEYAEKILRVANIDYRVIRYRYYIESDYKYLLERSKYVIWIGRQESQGIALQEALACGVPMIVVDVPYMGYSDPNEGFTNEEMYYKPCTAAEYFDDRCGLKINDIKELDGVLGVFEKNYTRYNPREYILENLSLKKQAKELILKFELYHGLGYEDGFSEKLLKNTDWVNRKKYYINYLKIKHLIKIGLIKTNLWGLLIRK